MVFELPSQVVWNLIVKREYVKRKCADEDILMDIFACLFYKWLDHTNTKRKVKHPYFL